MSLDRRKFLMGAGVAGGAALGAGLFKGAEALQHLTDGSHDTSHMRAVGTTNTDDFDPFTYVTEFNRGDRVSDIGGGRKLREYEIVALDEEIEVAPGVVFPGWTYNGQIPGPTLRANEGDRIRITFQNDGSHPHTMHFHGIHTPEMDGIPGVGDGMIDAGDSTVYEFDAEPYGCHLYHCHSIPLKRHIHKGLYGAFIVDPPGGYDELLGEAHREYVMVMNGFDTNFDGDNEIYAVNTKAFAYAERPLEVVQDELVRVFLVNATEFDPVNSFHLHAHFFDYYNAGRIENRQTWVDNIMQCQAERGILQFRPPYPGKLMFHAHQSEFAELGWMGFFDVKAKAGVDEAGSLADSSNRGPADPRYGPERDESAAGAAQNGTGEAREEAGKVREAAERIVRQDGPADKTGVSP